MKKILEEINNLKERINYEIELLSCYKELNFICEELSNKLNKYEYSLSDHFSLIKYKVFLEDFLENEIGYANNLIINKHNKSVFDNSSENQIDRINELEKEIEKTLDYIKVDYPDFSESVTSSYNELRRKYHSEYNNIISIAKKKLNMELRLKNESILSLYPDTNSLMKSYISSLEGFNVSCQNIKVFNENDKKIKEVLANAYKIIKDDEVIKKIKKIEDNYNKAIHESMGQQFVIYGPHKIQEIVMESCAKVEELTKLEINKNEYYQKILDMTLNTDIKIILDLEEYVNSNNIFQREFYYNLFAIIEKDKYIGVKYGIKPTIYDSITKRSQLIIEKIFLNRLKELNDDEKSEMIVNLKKYGYNHTLDKEYKELFDNYAFVLKTNYSKESISDNKENILECKHVTSGLLEKHYNIINKKTGKVIDKVFAIKNENDLFVNLGDLYRFSGEVIKFNGPRSINRYYDNNGKRINPFSDNSLIESRFLDFYLVKNKNGRIVTDLKFKKVFDLNSIGANTDMLVDHTNKMILILDNDKNVFYLFDKNFNKIKEIKASEILDDKISSNKKIYISDQQCLFNDGIVSINVIYRNERYIYYYDIINMKKITSFVASFADKSLYGYSEGLYNYRNNVGMMGYKDINGKVVIPPKFIQTNPFFNKCALVYDSNPNKGFIDYQGNMNQCDDIIYYEKEIVEKNISNYQYEIFDTKSFNRYVIKANNTYIIDSDEKIVDIRIKEKAKNKILK